MAYHHHHVYYAVQYEYGTSRYYRSTPYCIMLYIQYLCLTKKKYNHTRRLHVYTVLHDEDLGLTGFTARVSSSTTEGREFLISV